MKDQDRQEENTRPHPPLLTRGNSQDRMMGSGLRNVPCCSSPFVPGGKGGRAVPVREPRDTR
jgi:hypothetical protein